MNRRLLIVPLLAIACAMEPAPEAELGEVAQADTWTYCPITPFTESDRWWCQYLINGTVGEEYFRFDNNSSFPTYGSGPYSGTLTQWYPNAPRATVGYNLTLRDGTTCQRESAGTTFWTLNTANGVSCDLWANHANHPTMRKMTISCNNNALLVCWEHKGPRAFGGLN